MKRKSIVWICFPLLLLYGYPSSFSSFDDPCDNGSQ